jgi:hypothetical protein
MKLQAGRKPLSLARNSSLAGWSSLAVTGFWALRDVYEFRVVITAAMVTVLRDFEPY